MISLHVVGVAAEPLLAPGGIDGVGRWLSSAAKHLKMLVSDSMPRQGCRQGIAIELGHSPRLRELPDVDQELDALSLQQRQNVIDGARGVADGVDQSANWMTARSAHAQTQCRAAVAVNGHRQAISTAWAASRTRR